MGYIIGTGLMDSGAYGWRWWYPGYLYSPLYNCCWYESVEWLVYDLWSKTTWLVDTEQHSPFDS